MPTYLKLERNGNSARLSIRPLLIDHLGLTFNDYVRVDMIHGGQLVLTPQKDPPQCKLPVVVQSR